MGHAHYNLSNKSLPKTFHTILSLLEYQYTLRKIWNKNTEILIIMAFRVGLLITLNYLLISLFIYLFYSYAVLFVDSIRIDGYGGKTIV